MSGVGAFTIACAGSAGHPAGLNVGRSGIATGRCPSCGRRFRLKKGEDWWELPRHTTAGTLDEWTKQGRAVS